jgi:hypothetical protein
MRRKIKRGSHCRYQLIREGVQMKDPNKTTAKKLWTSSSYNSFYGFNLSTLVQEDGGVYSCTADNGVGSPAEALVSLQVLCK